jgi:hypothetical protein
MDFSSEQLTVWDGCPDRCRSSLLPPSSSERDISSKPNSLELHCGIELASAQALTWLFSQRTSDFFFFAQILGTGTTHNKSTILVHLGFNFLKQ